MEKKKHLSIFLLAMMNVAIILSLRGLPLMAKEGLSLVFYLTFSLVVFLIPTALVSAELASGWPEEGGVFRWVSEAFGERFGFTAIWLQWLQNIFWYPTVLSFAAATLSYLFSRPELAENPMYNVITISVIYWGSIILSLRGIQFSSWLSSIGALVGTILPAFCIICLGIIWFFSGNSSSIDMKSSWIPDLHSFSNVSLLGGIVLLFAGIEVNAVHVKEVKDPTKSFPKAILLSVILIFFLFFLGSFSIATVLAPSEISLTAGLMQAFSRFLQLYNLGWLTPVLGLFISFGVLGGIAAWIVGPSKGLLETAKKGLLPSFLAYKNRRDVPSHILITQGLIVTLLSQVYLIMPTVSSAFFLLSDLTVILYLVMYLLMFASALYLRYKEPEKERIYKVPGGIYGMWFVCLLGMLGALFAIFIGFFPPSQIKVVKETFYVGFLAVGLFISVTIPQIIVSVKKRKNRG